MRRYLVLVAVENDGGSEEDDVEHIQLALEQFDMLVVSAIPQSDPEGG